jgi:lipopolysaccharide cholinephosphotransferase
MSSHPHQAYLDAVQQVGDQLLEALATVCRDHHIEFFVHAGTLLGTVREGGWIPWDDDVDVAIFRRDYERLRTVCNEALPSGLRFSDARSDMTHLSSIPKVLFVDSERFKTGRERLFRPAESRHLGLDLFILDAAPRNRMLRRSWQAAIYLSERVIVARAMTIRHALQAEKTHRALTLSAVLVSRVLSTRAWRQVHYGVCVAPATMRPGSLVCLANDFKPEFRKLLFRRKDFHPPREAKFGRIVVPVPARAETVLRKMYGDDFMKPPSRTSDRQPLHLQEGVSIKLDGVQSTFAAPVS